jgi:hypothetical protein
LKTRRRQNMESNIDRMVSRKAENALDCMFPGPL